MKKLLLSILFTLKCILFFAQNPYTYIIDKTTGLPSNSVYDIFQDKKGFMWFATGEGLCKYDGIKFYSYSNKEQTSKSGSNIQQDKFGRIWYINFDGYLYYVSNNKLHAFHQKNSIGYYEFGIIDNKLFTIQKNNIKIYDLKSLKLLKTINFDNANFKATHISEKHFYVFTNKIIKIDTNLFVTESILPKEINETKSIIIESNSENVYIASKTDAKLFTFKNNIFKTEAILKGSSIQNLSYADNKLWLATTSGLISYNNFTFTTYFKDVNISSIYKDQENKYWISTLTNGLLYIPNFNSILFKCNSKPVTLLSDNNKLLIGYENDILSEFDPKSFQENIKFKGNSNHEIYKIYKDNSNYFITSNNFKIINNYIKEANNAVKDIVKIDAKFYAFAASGLCGIFCLDETKTSEWDKIYYKHFVKEENSFKENRLLKDVRGKAVAFNPTNKTIYFATNKGIFTQNLTNLYELKYKQKSFFSQRLYYYKTAIYLLSNENEILKIDNKNKISNIVIPKTIISDDIKNIKLLENNIYIFTNNSIYQYNLASKKTCKTQIITSDISVSDIAIVNNQTIFATSKGLIIKPNFNLNDENLPKFILNKIMVNNKINPSKSLEYFENNLSFDFSVLAFLPNSKYPISYKINESDWVTLDDNQRSLKFSSLASGDYNIQFKIEDLEKTTQKTINYKFCIEKPFWLRWPFIIFCGIVASIVIYLLYQNQLKKVQQKNQIELNRISLENNLNQSKLTAIKSQMNPHFFYNALNTIQSYILSNDKKEAITYLNKFSSLTRMILELTEKNNVSLQEEINTIQLHLDLEKARFFNDFEYEINIKTGLDCESTRIPTMLLQPFLENAIKHGLLHLKGFKKLTISFEKVNEILKITIDDNGIGRKKSTELNAINQKNHISFATNAIAKRLEILNKNKANKITVTYIDKFEFEEATGTTVILNIP